MKEDKKYSANFLWGNDDDSIESLGYEFANAKTEAYQKECWEAILKHFNEESRKAFEAGREIVKYDYKMVYVDEIKHIYPTFDDYLNSK